MTTTHVLPSLLSTQNPDLQAYLTHMSEQIGGLRRWTNAVEYGDRAVHSCLLRRLPYACGGGGLLAKVEPLDMVAMGRMSLPMTARDGEGGGVVVSCGMGDGKAWTCRAKVALVAGCPRA
jgi:hypothetical protein